MIKVKLNSNRDIMELPTSERAMLIRDFWDSMDSPTSTNEQLKAWLTKEGWDIANYSNAQLDEDWDVAAEWEDKHEPEYSNYDDSIETAQDAARWLRAMHEEYGNTYFFPAAEKRKLNELIERFGNTYFWNR